MIAEGRTDHAEVEEGGDLALYVLDRFRDGERLFDHGQSSHGLAIEPKGVSEIVLGVGHAVAFTKTFGTRYQYL